MNQKQEAKLAMKRRRMGTVGDLVQERIRLLKQITMLMMDKSTVEGDLLVELMKRGRNDLFSVKWNAVEKALDRGEFNDLGN